MSFEPQRFGKASVAFADVSNINREKIVVSDLSKMTESQKEVKKYYINVGNINESTIFDGLKVSINYLSALH